MSQKGVTIMFMLHRSSVPNLSKLCAAMLFALFFLSYTAEAAVPDILPTASQAHRQQVENQTMSLARLMASHRRADGAGKDGTGAEYCGLWSWRDWIKCIVNG